MRNSWMPSSFRLNQERDFHWVWEGDVALCVGAAVQLPSSDEQIHRVGENVDTAWKSTIVAMCSQQY